MRAIWKYPLRVVDDQQVTMPIGTEILTVQVQNNIPCLWAYVNVNEEKLMNRHIRIHGTGHTISDNDKLKYISTFQMENGLLVFHVFELLG